MAGVVVGRARVVDLSYAIRDDLPPWPGEAKSFEARVESTVEREGYFTRSFWMREHYGTHLDAPAHFDLNGMTVEQIPVERLFGPAILFDVCEAAAKEPDYELSAECVGHWESAHGQIPAGSIALLRSGWSLRWPDAIRYRNEDSAGRMHFPGFSEDAARLLIDRGAFGIGVDTMSVDPGQSEDYRVHRLTLGAGLYQIENLADLGAVPEAGAFLVVAPLKLQGGSGGPCRVFAILP